jgi:four helix bundle protein
VLAVYRTTSSWPADERYGMTAQIRRAVVAAASDIVEGNTRRSPKDRTRFFRASAGSLAEAGYLVRLAIDLGYLRGDEATALQALRDDAARLTWCMVRAGRQEDTRVE